MHKQIVRVCVCVCQHEEEAPQNARPADKNLSKAALKNQKKREARKAAKQVMSNESFYWILLVLPRQRVCHFVVVVVFLPDANASTRQLGLCDCPNFAYYDRVKGRTLLKFDA